MAAMTHLGQPLVGDPRRPGRRPGVDVDAAEEHAVGQVPPVGEVPAEVEVASRCGATGTRSRRAPRPAPGDPDRSARRPPGRRARDVGDLIGHGRQPASMRQRTAPRRASRGTDTKQGDGAREQAHRGSRLARRGPAASRRPARSASSATAAGGSSGSAAVRTSGRLGEPHGMVGDDQVASGPRPPARAPATIACRVSSRSGRDAGQAHEEDGQRQDEDEHRERRQPGVVARPAAPATDPGDERVEPEHGQHDERDERRTGRVLVGAPAGGDREDDAREQERQQPGDDERPQRLSLPERRATARARRAR